MSKRTVWESSAAPEYGLLTCSSAPGATRTCDPPLRSYLTRSSRLPASSFSTSSCCPSLSEPTGSESSGASRRVAPFAELLIDCDEDRTLRAVLVGMLREGQQGSSR